MSYVSTVQAEATLLKYWKLDEASGATSFAATVGSTAITPSTGTAAPLVGAPGLAEGTSVYFAGDDYAASAATLDLSAYNKIVVERILFWDAYTTQDLLEFEFGPSISGTTDGFLSNPNSGSPVSNLFAVSLKGDVGFSIAGFPRIALGQWHHVVTVYDKSASTNETSLYVDGTLIAASSRPFNSNNTNSFGNKTLYLFQRTAGTLIGQGRIQHLAIYSDLSAARITAHFNALPATPLVSYSFVVHGDSLSTDFGLSGTATFPQLLAIKFTSAMQKNYSVAGQRIDQQASNAATQSDAVYAGLSPYTFRYLPFLCGVNDIGQGESGADTYTEYVAFHAARRSGGSGGTAYLTIGYTIPKAASLSTGQDTERQAFNALIRADHSFCDYFVDLDVDSRFSNTGNTTYYQSDGVHYTVAGRQVVADLTYAAITDSTPPAEPANFDAGDVSGYAFTLSWDAVTGDTVTYVVRKNGTLLTGLGGQSGTTLDVSGAVDGDVFTLQARDLAGNLSTAASVTFHVQTGGGGALFGTGIFVGVGAA